MTLRLPMFLAASLLLASHAAYASPAPMTTDEARALAASRKPASTPRLTVAPAVVSTNTDEVRALFASLAPPTPPRSTGSAVVVATNTDEVRAAFGRAPAPAAVRSSAEAAAAAATEGGEQRVVCQKSCSCHHG